MLEINKNCSRLEFLPNEILLEIFQYFNAQYLFQYFYNLNSRFNILLQSVNNLSLSLNTSHSNEIHRYDYLAPYINILIIDGRVQINLNYFTKLRHLILLQPIDELLKQLEINSLPYLEHLYIRLVNHMEDNPNKIVLNDFPNLKSCCIYKTGLLTISTSWTQMSSLRILKIEDMDLVVYKSILSSCPNLYFLKFTRIISYNESMDNIQHIHLKKLIIAIPWFEELSEDCDMNYYFSCIPNLEQLTIHRTNESKSINESFLKFDWYSSLINTYLPLLSHYTYYFHILKSRRRNSYSTQKILNEIQENFRRIHRHLNQCQFIIDI
jgi:hypothetical protein